MKKIISYSLLFLWIFCYACNRKVEKDLRENAYQQARVMGDAQLSGDFEKLVDFIHPNVVSYMGGRAVFIEQMKSDLNKNSIQYYKIEIEFPDTLIKTETGYQTVIYQTTVLFDGRDQWEDRSPLISFSDEKGEKWFFIQYPGDMEKVRKIIPEISNHIKIEE